MKSRPKKKRRLNLDQVFGQLYSLDKARKKRGDSGVIEFWVPCNKEGTKTLMHLLRFAATIKAFNKRA